MRNRPLALRYTSPFLLSAFLLSGCGMEDQRLSSSVQAKGAALHQADDCGDLLWQIQEDAISKLDHQVEAYKKAGVDLLSGRANSDGGISIGGSVSATDSASADEQASAAPGAGAASGVNAAGGTSDAKDSASSNDSRGESGTTAGDDARNTFSKTNTQVEDVDEADIVKIGDNGNRIYVLHGSLFKVVAALPADKMKELGETQVEGVPYELFVNEGKATVFSRVVPNGITAKRNSNSDDGGCYNSCCSAGAPFTQISVFDVEGDTPKLEREMIFEGSYSSSRRHGDVVRAILQGGFNAHDLYSPDIETNDSFGRQKSVARLENDLQTWRNEVAADIRASTLDDWVPRSFEKEGKDWVKVTPDCGSYYIPQPGLVAGGVTQVVSFAAHDDEIPQITSVLGGSEHVYANNGVMVLAQTDWSWDRFNEGNSSKSSVHEFKLDGLDTRYSASGFVPGYLKNQFSMDEQAGVIRLSTTEQIRKDPKNNPWDLEPVNTILTLEAKAGELVQIDRTEAMGEPGELIFSTRFLGDKAYVVTFRNTDPLFVVDMSEPKDLKILGSLHIPGFSDYIHPLGTDHLLTIGKDVGEIGIAVDGGGVDIGAPTDGGSGGATSTGGTSSTGGAATVGTEPMPVEVPETPQPGVSLQIFDVSDPTNPRLAHKESFGGFSDSAANRNHKAFTYVKDYFGEGRDLLLFPIVTYEPQYKTGLEVLEVSVQDGFKKMGTIDHAAMINPDCPAFVEDGAPCYYYNGDEMRRGMQVNEFVYALSQGGLSAHKIEDIPSGAVSSLQFSLPVTNSCSYGDEKGDAGGNPVSPEEDPVSLPGVETPPLAMGGASGTRR